MPDERVSDDVHVVLLTEFDEGVGWAEVVPVGSRPWMDELPLQVVFRRNLVELLFDESNVLLHQLLPSATTSPCRNAAVDRHTDQEMILIGGLQCGRGGRLAGDFLRRDGRCRVLSKGAASAVAITARPITMARRE